MKTLKYTFIWLSVIVTSTLLYHFIPQIKPLIQLLSPVFLLLALINLICLSHPKKKKEDKGAHSPAACMNSSTVAQQLKQWKERPEQEQRFTQVFTDEKGERTYVTVIMSRHPQGIPHQMATNN